MQLSTSPSTLAVLAAGSIVWHNCCQGGDPPSPTAVAVAVGAASAPATPAIGSSDAPPTDPETDSDPGPETEEGSAALHPGVDIVYTELQSILDQFAVSSPNDLPADAFEKFLLVAEPVDDPPLLTAAQAAKASEHWDASNAAYAEFTVASKGLEPGSAEHVALKAESVPLVVPVDSGLEGGLDATAVGDAIQ